MSVKGHDHTRLCWVYFFIFCCLRPSESDGLVGPGVQSPRDRQIILTCASRQGDSELCSGYGRRAEMAEQCLRRIFTCCLAAVCLVIVYLSRIDTRTWRQPFRIAPATRHSLYPTNWTLIDLKRFEFLLNSDVCAEGDSVKLLLSVTSHPGHVALRQAFRRALPSHILEEFAIRRVFVLAKINPIQKGYDQVSQTVVEQEHILYGDIVQGDFLESYRNLSYKHVLGLKYALHYCPQTSFVLKMDDDTAVDLFRMLALLETLGTQESLTIVGSLMNINERKVLRDLDSKWYVTYDEYPSTIYPNFVSGWAYGTTLKGKPHLAHLVAFLARTDPFLPSLDYSCGAAGKMFGAISYVLDRRRVRNRYSLIYLTCSLSGFHASINRRLTSKFVGHQLYQRSIQADTIS